MKDIIITDDSKVEITGRNQFDITAIFYTYDEDTEEETETDIKLSFDIHEGQEQTLTDPAYPTEFECTEITSEPELEINDITYDQWRVITPKVEEAYSEFCIRERDY